jgi:hypothetical protein
LRDRNFLFLFLENGPATRLQRCPLLLLLLPPLSRYNDQSNSCFRISREREGREGNLKEGNLFFRKMGQQPASR